MSAPAPCIALLTDFGVDDWYVGVMKGVFAQRAPGVPLLDVSHAVAPGDIRAGAFVLENARPWYPAGTVFLVVIDPGVGTKRRPIAVRAQEHYFVGPDNGVLTPALTLDGAESRLIDPTELGIETLSKTFHGRDLFSPTAAHLAVTGEFASIGEVVTDAIRLDPGRLLVSHDRLVGQIVYVDRFGNCITDITAEQLEQFRGDHDAAALQVRVGGAWIHGAVDTYGRVDEGELCALVGSSGRLEIAVRLGDASEQLGLQSGDSVEVQVPATGPTLA